MLYGYFEQIGSKYCLICLRPKGYINGTHYTALVLGTWDSNTKCHFLKPDENGRTLSELREVYSIMMCEDLHDAQLSIRRFEIPICLDAEEHICY
jgi:hypothetical protein